MNDRPKKPRPQGQLFPPPEGESEDVSVHPRSTEEDRHRQIVEWRGDEPWWAARPSSPVLGPWADQEVAALEALPDDLDALDAMDKILPAVFPDTRVTAPDDGYLLIRQGINTKRDPELARLEAPAFFLDLETLGFHGRPLFLIGLLARLDNSWEVVQLLARDYAEEEAILQKFCELAEVEPVWQSFNGKSFDVPFLRNRAAFFRIRFPEPEEHLDLLHAARRVYKKVLPNCRLQTLEANLFDRVRVRDLPGWGIPEVYHEFVRTGRLRDVLRVLLHNREDLITLARLHVHLSEDS